MRLSTQRLIFVLMLALLVASSCDLWQKKPGIPREPSGPASGRVAVPLTFSTTCPAATDSASFRFAWGDGDTSPWSSLVGGDDGVSMTHTYTRCGIYELTAQAKSQAGTPSAWSEPLEVTLAGDRAPNIVEPPEGVSYTDIGTEFSLSARAYDPDGDSVAIRLDWNDGSISDWSSWVARDDSVPFSHVYTSIGAYYVRAQAKDVFGDTSAWSDTHLVAAAHPVWKSQVGAGDILELTVLPDGSICLGCLDNYAYWLNPDGTVRWRYKTGGAVWACPAVGADGTVYAGSDDNWLYAIGSDGALKWRYKTGDRVLSSPVVGEDSSVCVVSSDGILYAFSSTGALQWQSDVADASYWNSPAVAADGTVYIGHDGDALLALNPDSSLEWRYGFKGWGAQLAITQNGMVIVTGNIPYPFYAVNPNGTLQWQCQQSNRLYGSPLALGGDGTVYAVSTDGCLTAVGPDGALKWQYGGIGDTIYGSPVVGSDGTIYVAAQGGCVLALSPLGNLEWYWAGPTSVWTVALGANNIIYAGLADGSVYALQGNGASAAPPWPMPHHDARHTGRAAASR
jgi:outer membrane protein assembly factor BamB